MSFTRYVLTATILVASACAGQPNATECATGIVCPEGTKCAAVQPVCLTNDCGDGIQQLTEKCDDGNIVDGDGCAANCLSTEVCGDTVINSAAGEICDDGNTDSGDGCAADCRSVEICGNMITDSNEACDDGNTVSGDGCSANCKSKEICGNGIVDINEKCDDMGTPGGCNDDCQGGTGCGDGAIDRDALGNALEECDDGNMDDTDDCMPVTCKLSKCGDGVQQLTGARPEECDPGAAGETTLCNIDCTSASCGDGKVNHALLEECDAGPGLNADDRDCTQNCKINFCGDGLENTQGPAHVEECDDNNNVQDDGCSNQCTNQHCGNGIVEDMEACDDNNTANGDGCDSTCHYESCGDGIVNNGEACDPGTMPETAGCNSDCTAPMCGDRKINHAAGEECDDGNSVDTDSCRNTTCKLARCGDGVTGPGEDCDDGNLNNKDGCSNLCKFPVCGNGILEMGETCDDHNTANGDGCNSTCHSETCGDGIVNNGEACDPGTMPETAGCNADCTAPVCGDRIINHAAGEECDDGNSVDDDFCRNTTCKLNFCGDGKKSPAEACDDGNTNNNDGCSNACTLPSCGDGIKNGTDECDDGNMDNTDNCLNNCHLPTCGDGFVWASHEQCDNAATTGNGPDKDCTAQCRNNVCGDGFRDLEGPSQEACDDNNNANETSCPYGQQSCQLCNMGCTAVENLTGNVCGDGVLTAPEVCDDGNRVTEASCPYGTPSCAGTTSTLCNSSCTAIVMNLSGPFCGDGIVQNTGGPTEVCDDRSPTQSCGLCGNSCGESRIAAVATGLIIAPPGGGGMGPNNLHDGDTITISDGENPPLVLEFDTAANGVTAGRVDIDAPSGDNPQLVRDRIKTAINSSSLDITATDAGTTAVTLTHKATGANGANGNVPITTTATTPDLFIVGMSGGWGRDCANGVGCKSDDDCASNDCNGATHVCQ